MLGDEREDEEEASDHRRHNEPRGVVRVEGIVESHLLSVLRTDVYQEPLERLAEEWVDPLRPQAQRAVRMGVLVSIVNMVSVASL